MKFHFILFIVGVLFITAGYAKQMKPSCDKGVEVKFVPRTVFDEIQQGTAYTETDYGLGVDSSRKKDVDVPEWELWKGKDVNEETNQKYDVTYWRRGDEKWEDKYNPNNTNNSLIIPPPE